MIGGEGEFILYAAIEPLFHKAVGNDDDERCDKKEGEPERYGPRIHGAVIPFEKDRFHDCFTSTM